MNLSRHDQSLLAITVFVLLFGILGMGMRTQIERIDQHRSQIRRLEERIRMQNALIDAKPLWEQRYADVRDKMDVFPRDAQVQTHWMSIMDRAANAHNIRILQRSRRDESVVAGVCELPIEVRSWEGTLDSLVSFMIELETRGVMLELRELRVSPIQNRQGYLKGSFLLSCAYMRSDHATAQPPVGASPEAATTASSGEATLDPSGETDDESGEFNLNPDNSATAAKPLPLSPEAARIQSLMLDEDDPPSLPGETP